ncbi:MULTISPECIES: nitroreductase family protein [unclassified Clostridium]|uniref:nitroreductase family protein n=1 Tax=unclassified Clostridium TaxID=2614128 RepID=UPI0002979BD3|nr:MULTISPECIES: nitroreductase family protein [unclassified Clostridium]EKQ57903.1 MAG: nitroreductase [Clostridium sp. Maddingley MBC34-26]
MMIVDNEKCIGCGLCVKDCFPKAIKVADGKAEVKNIMCMKCGHCIAVCPKGAVSTDEYNMEDVKEYNEAEFKIEPEMLLNFIKFRRTTRQFINKDVETEKILKIVEAGRFTQTGTNSQNVSYIVVKDKIEQLKEMALESLKIKGEDILKNLNPETIPFKRYAQMWIKMYNEYKENPKVNDKLFFNAPIVILAISDSPINATLASSNMELMTNALGLGTFFSGFFAIAAQGDEGIRNLLGLEGKEEIVTCMVIGYPNVKYIRTVPRKDPNILWK